MPGGVNSAPLAFSLLYDIAILTVPVPLRFPIQKKNCFRFRMVRRMKHFRCPGWLASWTCCPDGWPRWLAWCCFPDGTPRSEPCCRNRTMYSH